MRWRIPLLLSLIAIVAVSCDQQPAEPTGDQVVSETPAFNFSNNDGFFAHGRIYRHPHGGIGWWGLDGESGLIVHLSTESGHYCGYGVDTDPVAAQLGNKIHDRQFASLQAVWTNVFHQHTF